MAGKVFAVSKRTELVTLNASALKDSFCLSVMLQVLRRAISIPKYPCPRKLFRCPDSPGNGKRQLLLMKSEAVVDAPPLQFWPVKANALMSPAQSVNAPVFGVGPVKTALPVSSQLVGKSKPLPTADVNPLVHRASPDTDQPPTATSIARFQLEPHFFPRPKGRSYTTFMLT